MSADAVATLRERRAELVFRLSEVDALLTMLGADPEDESKDGEPGEVPASRPKAERPARADGTGRQKRGGKREEVARVLADADGPLTLTAIAERMGTTAALIGYVLKHPWFEQTAPKGPYRLTEAGRAALGSSTA